MLPFCGRFEDTVKMRNKPIQEGFKVWVLADLGYVYNWLWFSGHKKKGTEVIGKKDWEYPINNKGTTALFALTFTVIIYLAQLLVASFNRTFILILDNLFLNIEVAQALLLLNITYCGTTRKNASGFPPNLIKIKEHNRLYLWDSYIARITKNILCFIWQDNNAVIGLTTAHSLHRSKEDTIIRNRKRPKPTSVNTRITRLIFRDLHRKELAIPRVIDDYNYYINKVDLANQLRA
jgi:Transposase IS4